jgi:Tol biopolymer transport system component
LIERGLIKTSLLLISLILYSSLVVSCADSKETAEPTDEPSPLPRQMTLTATAPQAVATKTPPLQPTPTLTVTQITPTQQTKLEPIPSPIATTPSRSLVLARAAEENRFDLFILSADGSYLMNLTKSPDDEFSPSWSPDLQRIAFVSSGVREQVDADTYRPGQDAFYMVNVDGTGLTNLTQRLGVKPSNTSYLRWSYDGHNLALDGEADNDPGIFILNAEGTQLHRITTQDPAVSSPSWSQDNQKIYYETTTDTGAALIAVNLADIHSPEIVANLDHALAYFFSPDQTKIAASIREFNWVVGIMAMEGNEWAMIPNPDPRSGIPFVYDLSWSPDSSRLAFVVQYINEQSGLYVVNADGTDLERIDDVPTFDYSPPLYWFQDNQQLAYMNMICPSSPSNCEWVIHIADVNSGQIKTLDEQLNGDFTPILSPDGEQFLLIGHGEGEQGLYMMQADGSGLKRIMEQLVTHAMWAPTEMTSP